MSEAGQSPPSRRGCPSPIYHLQAMENGDGSGHVVFVWSPTGYTLRDAEGEPPPVGHELEEEGRTLVVTKVGPSPLPGDTRPCAYTVGK